MKRKLVINPYSVKGIGQVFIKIQFDEGKGTLSISGVEAPTSDGNCKGSAGQIDMSFREYHENDYEANPGFTMDSIAKLMDIWGEWHLNDMTKGTPLQEQAVKHWLSLGNKFDYEKVCEYLKSIGLYTDRLPEGMTAHAGAFDENGLYKYAYAWLKRDVPADVVQWLFSLPETTNHYAWV